MFLISYSSQSHKFSNQSEKLLMKKPEASEFRQVRRFSKHPLGQEPQRNLTCHFYQTEVIIRQF